jgi:predicted RND superfamily exporter protein
VTTDYRKTSLWLQLKSGDNRDMEKVVKQVEGFFAQNPPPMKIRHNWFGLTYINVKWQEKMVSGMLQAFLGSFLAVLLMMTLLFRSALWGLLSMVPLTVTIGAIYGAIGLIGKDYDMPVAVLSSLSLGLAVDYAIHFLARSRELRRRHGSWKAAAAPVFGEPARAISRNVIVIGVGFLPLLAAPLVPYKTVGIFIAAILLVAGVASLLILPALIRLLERFLFPRTRAMSVTCMCGTCVVSALTLVALVAVNVYQFLKVGVTPLTWSSLVAVIVLAGTCAIMSRREKCGLPADGEAEGEAARGPR